MEMNLFIGAVIDITNTKASRILKKFCEQFGTIELVIQSSTLREVYKTSYEKNTDSKTIKHIIHFKSDEGNEFDISFELLRGKNEVQVMVGGNVITEDHVIKAFKALSATALHELGVTVDDYEESKKDFILNRSLGNQPDIDESVIEEIFDKVLKPIFPIANMYGIFNVVNVDRLNVACRKDTFYLFFNDGNSIGIMVDAVVISDGIYNAKDYKKYITDSVNEVNKCINAFMNAVSKPAPVTLTESQMAKVDFMIKSWAVPRILGVESKPCQDPIIVEEDDKNYYYIQGPIDTKSVLSIGIKNKNNGKIFALEYSSNLKGIYAFSFEEKIDKDGNINLKCLRSVDDELFNDLDEYVKSVMDYIIEELFEDNEDVKTILS
jgi:hypothetical protein